MMLLLSHIPGMYHQVYFCYRFYRKKEPVIRWRGSPQRGNAIWEIFRYV